MCFCSHFRHILNYACSYALAKVHSQVCTFVRHLVYLSSGMHCCMCVVRYAVSYAHVRYALVMCRKSSCIKCWLCESGVLQFQCKLGWHFHGTVLSFNAKAARHTGWDGHADLSKIKVRAEVLDAGPTSMRKRSPGAPASTGQGV